jgi:hypothetical protein
MFLSEGVKAKERLVREGFGVLILGNQQLLWVHLSSREYSDSTMENDTSVMSR